jgi:cell wall assembly regulator SMI1
MLEGFYDKTIYAGPAHLEDIDRAQATLGLRFPNDYIEFLRNFGAVVGRGIEIAGVVNKEKNNPPMWVDVVEWTIRKRETNGKYLDHGFLPISSDGLGQVFYLDLRTDGISPVVAVGLSVGEKVVADSFSQFALKLIEGELLIDN